ncbi:MAG TPA: protoporphyrinogen IX oxidase [Cytophagales bacterium]|jgi:protoporphyrinogen IX oxidase|nr:protoporphyrinogen IX oxidase [Cytophagales bacterium]
MYLYLKAFHIIFVVTWFAGLFYIVRLFIYNREAQDKPEAERIILQQQFAIMIRRLWLGITWPSCIITVILGTWLTVDFYPGIPGWLAIKIIFVAGLLLYHFSLHTIYRQQSKGIFKFTSSQLRMWNEVATLFLFAIVLTVVVRTEINFKWLAIGLLLFALVLTIATKIYKKMRK